MEAGGAACAPRDDRDATLPPPGRADVAPADLAPHSSSATSATSGRLPARSTSPGRGAVDWAAALVARGIACAPRDDGDAAAPPPERAEVAPSAPCFSLPPAGWSGVKGRAAALARRGPSATLSCRRPDEDMRSRKLGAPPPLLPRCSNSPLGARPRGAGLWSVRDVHGVHGVQSGHGFNNKY